MLSIIFPNFLSVFWLRRHHPSTFYPLHLAKQVSCSFLTTHIFLKSAFRQDDNTNMHWCSNFRICSCLISIVIRFWTLSFQKKDHFWITNFTFYFRAYFCIDLFMSQTNSGLKDSHVVTQAKPNSNTTISNPLLNFIIHELLSATKISSNSCLTFWFTLSLTNSIFLYSL